MPIASTTTRLRNRRPLAAVWSVLACALLIVVFTPESPAAQPRTLRPGWHKELRFDLLSPLAAKWELARRVLPPTLVDRLQRFERSQGVVAVEQTIDLGEESFDLYVPKHRPEAGYGLIVFVAPVDEFALPVDWRREFDRLGLLLVMPRDAGNEQSVFDRRMPLALHAFENVVRRYPVDAQRRYVAGFSGGSRVAQRLALGFPDLFSGALLFAGSDPFGEGDKAPPPRELFRQFVATSRVVFVSGGQDMPNRLHDAKTRESFEAHCMTRFDTVSVARLAHWVPPRRYLGKALDALESLQSHPPADEACLRRLEAEVHAALDGVESQLAGGQAQAAGEALGAAEDRYGGLAAPRSVELARRISAALGH